MAILTEKDILDGTKISVFFSTLSDEGKAMAIGYLSALRDKEVSIEPKELQETSGGMWKGRERKIRRKRLLLAGSSL